MSSEMLLLCRQANNQVTVYQSTSLIVPENWIFNTTMTVTNITNQEVFRSTPPQPHNYYQHHTTRKTHSTQQWPKLYLHNKRTVLPYRANISVYCKNYVKHTLKEQLCTQLNVVVHRSNKSSTTISFVISQMMLVKQIHVHQIPLADVLVI